MRLIFLGTPEFAVPTLERLVSSGHCVQAVYTQPDRPKGRGGQVSAPPVKQAAQGLGLVIRQPERIRNAEIISELQLLAPEAMVVVGYGQIIPEAILKIPPLGIINVHASLLPKYRGAAPIQWAIANGETETGVTTMRIDAGLDTGDMLLKWTTPIAPEETALELAPRMAQAGAELLIDTLAGLSAATIQPQPQDPAQATYAPILRKEDGRIDWQQPARAIHNRARGFLPWPGAWTVFRGLLFHIWRARLAEETGFSYPGKLSANGKRLLAEAGDGRILELIEVQIAGRKRMNAAAFLNGQRLAENEILGGEVESTARL